MAALIIVAMVAWLAGFVSGYETCRYAPTEARWNRDL